MLSNLEKAIMFSLVGKELYGLQIMKVLRDTQSRRVGFGSLYPALYKLEKKGYLSSRWGNERLEVRGFARRRYYSITHMGYDRVIPDETPSVVVSANTN